MGLNISSPSSDYTIQQILGSGSYGCVIQCKKLATDETVALKVFKSIEDFDIAKIEVELLQYLKSRGSDMFNIIRLNDSFTIGGYYHLEFEKLDMNLYDFLLKTPSQTLKLKEIRPILHQLAIALDFLQHVGVVHADLKPENIMIEDHLQQPMRIKIIDLGLAVTDPENHTGRVLQTIMYRSPEVLLGAPFSAAIDVWSLGCIAVELFTGSLLFSGDDEKEMVKQIVSAFGNPPENLLNSGLHTKNFFTRTDQWAFKEDIRTENLNSDPHKNLDFLRKLCTKEEEIEDERELASFIELVRDMLMVDPAERISPSQILQHPFMTMEYLVDHSIQSPEGNPAKKMKEDCDDGEILSTPTSTKTTPPSKRPRDETEVEAKPDESSPRKKRRLNLKDQDANPKKRKMDSEEATEEDKASPKKKRKGTDLRGQNS